MQNETGKPLERVFLIDAMAHIFRAYFAPMGMIQEPLRNSKGQVTQAVFVFTNLLRKLLNDETLYKNLDLTLASLQRSSANAEKSECVRL